MSLRLTTPPWTGSPFAHRTPPRARDGAVPLRVTGTSAAGAPFGGSVGAGEAVEIMTGAVMPRGADAVVRVEDTQRPDAQTVLVTVPVACGTSVRLAGGDTRAGDMVAARGDVVTSGRIALCATCGIARAPVHPRPRIAVCTGGDEVVEAGSGAALAPGEIYDSNSPMLLARLREWGFRRGVPWPPARRRSRSSKRVRNRARLRHPRHHGRGLHGKVRPRARRPVRDGLHRGLLAPQPAAGRAAGVRAARRLPRVRAAGQSGVGAWCAPTST